MWFDQIWLTAAWHLKQQSSDFDSNSARSWLVDTTLPFSDENIHDKKTEIMWMNQSCSLSEKFVVMQDLIIHSKKLVEYVGFNWCKPTCLGKNSVIGQSQVANATTKKTSVQRLHEMWWYDSRQNEYYMFYFIGCWNRSSDRHKNTLIYIYVKKQIQLLKQTLEHGWENLAK